MDGEACRDKIMSEEYWDFLLPDFRPAGLSQVSPERICFQEMDFDFQAVYVDSQILEPLSIDEYWYNSIPNCYALLDMEAMQAAGISAVQNYPTLQLKGNGVMIGIVDTGIDYRHPVFRKADGTTKIVGIWDQTIQGETPEGLDYGSVYTEAQINEALRSDNPLAIVPSVDELGHGTFLASIAAGNADPANQFTGAAPEAELAVVKLKQAKQYLREFYAIRPGAVCYQENDIMLGLTWLNRLARERNMPLVLCVALGTNFGGHNGTSLISNVLDRYSNILNRAVVIGAGNEAAQRHHFFHSFEGEREGESVTAEIRVGAGVEGFVSEIWTTIPNVVTVAITSPSGERTNQISLRQGQRYNLLFTFERTEVLVEYRLLLENNDSQLIFLRFRNPVQGIWKIEVIPLRTMNGDVHIWLPIQEFLSGEVFFLESNADTTLTEPSTSALPMTVAYYNGRDNGVDINSGRGYTRNGMIKPDFAAPGVEVSGAGPDGRFVTRTGSSVAVGITAGAVALLLEWTLSQSGTAGVNSIQLRNIIVLGTGQRAFMDYPNREWGYGTLNLFQALDVLRRL